MDSCFVLVKNNQNGIAPGREQNSTASVYSVQCYEWNSFVLLSFSTELRYKSGRRYVCLQSISFSHTKMRNLSENDFRVTCTVPLLLRRFSFIKRVYKGAPLHTPYA